MALDKITIIGSGPAGMGCAYALAKSGWSPVVIEREGCPGGLCRTINFHGYLFDIGGHRFLSKSEYINNLWREIMGKDMLQVKRLSRIYYRRKYFKYPLSFFNTFYNLGFFESFLCITSYIICKLFNRGNDNTFKGWVTNRFGKRLYNIFFNTYTKKVWGLDCKEISADWARQRIQALSLRVAIQNAFLGITGEAQGTLYNHFFYPRTGPGEFYQRLKELTVSLGSEFAFNKSLNAVKHNGYKITSIEIKDCLSGKIETQVVDYLFSSIPIPLFVKMLEPSAPKNVIAASRKLCFRSFVVVNVILDKEVVYPDQWIYVHSPEVRLARIQNYKNWSPAMVIDLKRTSLGLEYFCSEGDDLWNMNDVDLVNYAVDELEKIGVASRRDLITGFVVRSKDAYPVYSLRYKENLEIVMDYISRISNFQTMGRSGFFRYCNSDHAFLTGVSAARKFIDKGIDDFLTANTDLTITK